MTLLSNHLTLGVNDANTDAFSPVINRILVEVVDLGKVIKFATSVKEASFHKLAGR